jgi:hypothetical protein
VAQAGGAGAPARAARGSAAAAHAPLAAPVPPAAPLPLPLGSFVPPHLLAEAADAAANVFATGAGVQMRAAKPRASNFLL